MKQKPQVTVSLNQNDGNYLTGLIILAVSLALMLMSAVTVAGPGGSGPVRKSDAVKFEAIPGSDVKRVIITAKAAERLGIETGKVSEEQIARRQMVGGRIITADQIEKPKKKARGKFASLGKIEAASLEEDSEAASIIQDSDDDWVEVTLSMGEWHKLLKDEPVRILQLPTRDSLDSEVLAHPSGMKPVEDSKRTMLKLYYRLTGKDHGLTLYHRVRVELPLEGNDDERLVVPYSAVYYDAQGDGWVYVSPEPLVYQRQRIDIERVEGDYAVLNDGPAIGTQVVTVGAPLLYGAEVVFGR